MSSRRAIPGVLLVLCALLAVVPCSADTLFEDDFTTPRGRYEYHGGQVWSMRDGCCRFASTGQECYAVVNLDDRDRLQIEASICLDRRSAPGYVMAGLTVLLDSENHWRLLLVASPEDRPYFELVERHRGVHQAQHASPVAGTRLAGKQEGELRTWQYGHTYRLILSLSPEGITGEIRDTQGQGFWRSSFAFASGRAVRRGRPGLTAGGLVGEFRHLAVAGPAVPAASSLAVRPGPAGSVAIVEDQTRQVAAALEPLFAKEGFGVVRVGWDDLKPGRLTAAQLDLVVVADARRLPAAGVAAVTSYLRSGGKLIALGAPAFGQLLLPSPRGYVAQQQYPEALYDSLARRPLAVSADAWQRGCQDRQRPASIQAEPANGTAPAARTWKLTMDLKGWDHFGQAIPRAFADGRSLLCFRARGDAATPQLAVECIEQDRSRWIATVELSTDWRPVVLRPSDFSYWPDSPARRGGAGDRLEPANLASIHIGLSQSHTPRCEPGPHTFWIQDLATAADPNPDEPDFHVPDIEGLCPSYKLYVLPTSLVLRERTGRISTSTGSSPLPNPLSIKGVSLQLSAYALAPRETGLGFDRQRACRFVPVVDACDTTGRHRGALVWMMLGENLLPGAAWANVGVAEPGSLVEQGQFAQTLQPVLFKLAKTMSRGCFLLEAGCRYFSCRPGEPIELGALAMNAGRRDAALTLSWTLRDAQGKTVFNDSSPLNIRAQERGESRRTWTPPQDNASQFPYTVSVELLASPAAGQRAEPIDAVSHRIDLLPNRNGTPEEFVRVQGSQFVLGGKPWHMLGVNYWPNSQGGRPTVPFLQREYYNPELIEQDLAWMQSAGINLLSGIQAPVYADPDAPGAYRDLKDFVERCHRHGMKLFYFLPWGNPMHGADPQAIRQHIDRAGLRNHPAILAWELAWEPIYYSGPAGGKMDFLQEAWNAWLVERYGSLENAERDWDFRLPRTRSGPNREGAALPDHAWCVKHGPWDRAVAAFRRFFDDYVGQKYGELIRQLRRDDPRHLITFRFGACGIPDGARFAHAHSASVAKHVDFLCPEGYNLQTGGPWRLTPADDIRKGGLVTLYYRFLSREKPVVWMEFGYTVNGMHKDWKTGDERLLAAELANQRTEFKNFYQMFLESGARGAAPWWLPGGFRLGECSDFGILEPDGTERPACEVLKTYLPKFAEVPDHQAGSVEWSALSRPKPREDGLEPVIRLDFDAHYPEAWPRYSGRYLDLVKSGQRPYLLTDGTGSNSSNCPLVAVGNTPLDGHNPPKYLNAEFNSIQVKTGKDSPWREVRAGETVTVSRGQPVLCRVSVGNTGEAAWQASERLGSPGCVHLACRLGPSDKVLEMPIAAPTPYLADTEVREFAIPINSADQHAVMLQMRVLRTKPDGAELVIPFGQQGSFVVNVVP